MPRNVKALEKASVLRGQKGRGPIAIFWAIKKILGTIHSVQISPARLTQPWNHLNLWKENIENSFDWHHKDKVWEFFRLFLFCVRFTYKCRLQRDAGQLMWKLRLPPSQTPVEAGSQIECRSDLIIFVSYQVARATWELAIDIQNMLNDESALICYSEGGPSSFSY